MQKTHCRDCQGTELFDTVLSARNGVIIGRRTRTGDEWILVRCLVCLSCGNIMPYLDDPGVARLRTWAYGGEGPTAFPEAGPAEGAVPAAPDQPAQPAGGASSGADFGTIIILCLILGTLLGIGVALYSWMHA